jgi:hypothetical protein
MYEAYKPFRNHLRRFALLQSMAAVWHLAQHLENGAPLPPGLQPAPSAFEPAPTLQGRLYPWDLDILARELVLNAGPVGDRDLGALLELKTALGHIRRLEEETSKAFFAAGGDVMREMHRIGHRQFPWQRPPSQRSLVRYLKVFGRPEVAPFVVAQTGLTPIQVFQLTFAACGHFLREWGMNTLQDYAILGVDAAQRDAFYGRITLTTAQLREATQAQQHYDGRWIYAWNPLHAFPLVRFDPAHPERVICPIPSLLMRRMTEGLFYDLIGEPKFGDAFGRSFQTYVGEVLAAACPAPAFGLREEQEYWIGKNRKDGVDWILQDDTAVLFIECKTSRLRLDAKVSSDAEALEAGLDSLAASLVQHYKNIVDALEGRTTWANPDRPGFPLLVTLEDWWVFGPRIAGYLRESVKRKLGAEGLDPGLVEQLPYTVASAPELELAAAAIADAGIQAVMKKKIGEENRDSAFGPYLANTFPKVSAQALDLLDKEAWKALAPKPPA